MRRDPTRERRRHWRCLRACPSARAALRRPSALPAARGCGREIPRCGACRPSVSGLLIRLGQTALTRMLSRARSSDSDFTKACCAALLMADAIPLACGTLPAWPMMTMKRPPPWRRICGATRFANSHGPSTLVSSMPRQGIGFDVLQPSGQMRAGIADDDVDTAESRDDVIDQARDLGGDRAHRP